MSDSPRPIIFDDEPKAEAKPLLRNHLLFIVDASVGAPPSQADWDALKATVEAEALKAGRK